MRSFWRGSLCSVLLRFGNCNNGANDGVRARNWNNPAGDTNWNIGFAAILFNNEAHSKTAYILHR